MCGENWLDNYIYSLDKSDRIKVQQSICQKIFKIKRIVGKSNFSDQLKKIVKRYIRVGYATVCVPGFRPNHGL